MRWIRSADVARSSSGTIAIGIGWPISSSAVQPKMRSDAGFQMVTVRSSVNAWVASGDASTMADSSVLVRSSFASAAFRAAISEVDAARAARRVVVARQPRARANATMAVKAAMVTAVAVPMNSTLAGPMSTASDTPTAATITPRSDATRNWRESSEPWIRATLISGSTTAMAMPSGRTAPATIASTLIMSAAANRYGRRHSAAPSSPTMTAGSRTPASTRPGPMTGARARLTIAPRRARSGAPISATRSHACSRDGSRASAWIREDAARRRNTADRDPSSDSRNDRPTPTGTCN